ncbi:hypothetical protein ACIA5E_18445 [Nocardia asteroides]|uniref:hypothetical protein n=1 Tax=Nocardia asteroides TaxID=1824 RepID=UPI003791A199
MTQIAKAARDAQRMADSWPVVRAETGGGQRVHQAWRARMRRFDEHVAGVQMRALGDGVDLCWIEDARALGVQIALDPGRRVVRGRPGREAAVEVFFVDLLCHDVWHLERIAALDAARRERITAEQYLAGTDWRRERDLAERVVQRQGRAQRVVAGARITVAEGERLWGSGADAIRGMHAHACSLMNVHQLLALWRGYADARTPLRLPPYLPAVDSANAPPVWVEPSELHTPARMIDDATPASTTHERAAGTWIDAAMELGIDVGTDWIDDQPPYLPAPVLGHDPGVR